jgi:integrase
MAKVSFTAGRVSGHACPMGKSQAFLWDSDAPGLGLRATPSGAKAYIFQAKLHGATLRVTIGDPRSWTIEKARKEARRLQTVVDSGKDPREEAAAERAAHEARKREELRQDATVATAWTTYLAAQRSKWSERHYQDHLNLSQTGGATKRRGAGMTVPGPLAALMPLTLTDLSAANISVWLEKEAQSRPTNAEQSYRKLRAFIRWCGERPEFSALVPPDAYNARSVRDAVPRPKAKDDCLQREQLTAWFGAVRSIGNPIIAAYLQALLITGARREEMAALKWADVDFQWRSLALSDKVEDSGRVIPLTPYLASLLAALPRRNEWVFSSLTSSDGKIAEPRLAHNRATTVAGLPHVSLHGLRRSFGTLSEWVEVPVGVVAQIMGHKPSAIAEKHYRRRPLDLLRKWHDNIEAWMLEQAKIACPDSKGANGLRLAN